MRTITSPATQFDTPDFLESASDNLPDNPMAREALESTRMAIARWTGGIHLPRMLVPGMVRVSPQARWYAQANNDFQQWLSEGGFAHACETDPADITGAGTDSAPAPCATQATAPVPSTHLDAQLRALRTADTNDACVD